MKSPAFLKLHQEISHKSELSLDEKENMRWKCPFCPRKYLYQKIWMHMQKCEKEADEMAKGCPKCDKIYEKKHKRSYILFKKHISQPHPAIKCRICCDTFEDKKSHDEHFLKNHEKQPMLCNFCNEPFKSRKALNQHHKESKYRLEPKLNCLIL